MPVSLMLYECQINDGKKTINNLRLLVNSIFLESVFYGKQDICHFFSTILFLYLWISSL